MNIAINGFGRIGRIILRVALQKKINVVAINDPMGAENAAYLMKYDSTYGRFGGDVRCDKTNLIVNGNKIPFTTKRDVLKLLWKQLKVDVVVESTGHFTEKEAAEIHLKAGAKKVIITAPAEAPDITIVPGVNHKKLNNKHKIISVGSCTTNCVAPLLYVLNKNFGVEKALISTVHSYTNDQAIQDRSHSKWRRGRAAAYNIIPTSTGAEKAVTAVLPELHGKIEGIAMRVPVICGSIVDAVVQLKRKTSVKEINNSLRSASSGELRGILAYSEEELVSSDIIGDNRSSIIDGLSTHAVGDMVRVLSWYDNEYGYSSRVVDVLQMLNKFL